MDREIYLIYTCRDKLVGRAVDQSTVGGNGTLKAERRSISNKLRQIGVSKRLAHNVHIEILGHADQRVGNMAELVYRHSALFTGCTRTKGAISVTNISDFYVNSGIFLCIHSVLRGFGEDIITQRAKKSNKGD